MDYHVGMPQQTHRSSPQDDLGFRVPLVALVGRTENAFIAEFDRRIATSEFELSLAHSRNVLRHLGDEPRRASYIAGVCGVSKQAVSQQISHLELNGYIDSAPDPADHRARLLSLTKKGREAQGLVKRLFVEIEHEWAAQLGVERFDSLRTLLSDLLSQRRQSGDC